MDFVLGLPKTLRKHDLVLVIVDSFSNMANLLPYSRTSDAPKVAKIIFEGIVKLHYLPKTVMCDMNGKFTSYF